MTFFLTREYFVAVAPLVVLLMGALVARASEAARRVTLVLSAVAVVATWPTTATEAFSRTWAHDWLTGAAMLVLLGYAFVKRVSVADVFAAAVCAGANDVILLLAGARLIATHWLGLVVAAGAVLIVASTSELAAAGLWSLLLIPGLIAADWRATGFARTAFIVATIRVIAVATAPADIASRFGLLK